MRPDAARSGRAPANLWLAGDWTRNTINLGCVEATVMTGLALPDSHTHSPNERMLVETFPLGVAAARETYRALGALSG